MELSSSLLHCRIMHCDDPKDDHHRRRAGAESGYSPSGTSGNLHSSANLRPTPDPGRERSEMDANYSLGQIRAAHCIICPCPLLS